MHTYTVGPVKIIYLPYRHIFKKRGNRPMYNYNGTALIVKIFNDYVGEQNSKKAQKPISDADVGKLFSRIPIPSPSSMIY